MVSYLFGQIAENHIRIQKIKSGCTEKILYNRYVAVGLRAGTNCYVAPIGIGKFQKPYAK